jgi:hypothetical protein
MPKPNAWPKSASRMRALQDDRRVSTLGRLMAEEQRRLGRQPSDAELASLMAVSPKKIAKWRSVLGK